MAYKGIEFDDKFIRFAINLHRGGFMINNIYIEGINGMMIITLLAYVDIGRKKYEFDILIPTHESTNHVMCYPEDSGIRCLRAGYPPLMARALHICFDASNFQVRGVNGRYGQLHILADHASTDHLINEYKKRKALNVD